MAYVCLIQPFLRVKKKITLEKDFKLVGGKAEI